MLNKNQLPRKFFVRTFISYIVIIVLAFLLIYTFFQGSINKFYEEKLKTHLTQVGVSMAPKLIDLFTESSHEQIDRLAKHLGKRMDIRVTVIGPDGIVIGDSLAEPAEMENHGDRPEILQALKTKEGTGASTRFSSTMGQQMLYLAMQVEDQGKTLCVVRLSIYLSEIKQLMMALKWKFAAILLVLFIAALIMAWYFSRSISDPVQQIVAGTREFASGNFETRIFLRKKDELRDIAESFNTMVTRQKTLFDKLTENQEELKAIISTMKEGLLVINDNGKILLCNESFKTMFNKEDVVDKSYWEVIRLPGFEDFVNYAQETGTSSYEEISLDEQTFLVGFNRMELGNKLVITFGDVTRFKQLGEMKKDFVVNLTHELKTPLTAIKGFVETLEDEENITHTEYLEIIKRHTDRMNLIVSDMLTLSELEDSRRIGQFEPFDMAEMVNTILTIYRDKVKEKNLELSIDIPGKLPSFRGERFKIEQMFINLLDNAIKYTESGKVTVSVDLKKGTVNGNGNGRANLKHSEYFEIRIINTGSVIPSRSISRLFERFYVVDKSRSRKLGGTGLGLSIVKHVVKLHHGEIAVTSSSKDGTRFTICLPLYV